jgi:hypothetical protein
MDRKVVIAAVSLVVLVAPTLALKVPSALADRPHQDDDDDDDDDDESPTAVSQFATVEFDGAVVGLTKADGSTWDLSAVSSISAEDRKRFQEAVLKATAKAAVTNPLAAAAGVVAVIGVAVISTKAKPDPTGTVELMIDGKTVGGEKGRIQLPRQLDTYTPSWSLGPWPHVPLDSRHDVRLRLRLEDWDPETIGGNDQIGTVVVNSDDLLRAAKLRKVLPVYVGDQSQDQLVYVNVSVTMESNSGH